MALFISFFGSGVTINSHFCGSKLKSVEINEAAHSCCAPESTEIIADQNIEKSSCCSFDSDFIFNSFEKIDLKVNAPFFASLNWNVVPSTLRINQPSSLPNYNKPPPLSGVNLLVRIQRFTC